MTLAQIPWDDFHKIVLVNRLRQLIGEWWDIQINFTDEKGFLRGVPKGKFFNPLNSVCQFITKADASFRGCMSTVHQTAIRAHTRTEPLLDRCHAGFSTLSVPVCIDGRYLGCGFGDGFLAEHTAAEQKIQIFNYLRSQFGEGHEVLDRVHDLPVLSEKDISYLTKLIKMMVEEILISQCALSEAKEEISYLQTELGRRYHFDRMTGKSAVMQQLYSMVEKISDAQSLVLIRGENGTGKELIARSLHYSSKRKKQKFLVVNCGAFNENLLESELFGHVKGSFTGAIKDKIGLFEAAAQGTLFLDEVGDTSTAMQVKLLRILQEGTYTPVGSTEVKQSSARVVCATNKDLERMVKEGLLREDLYYRLNVLHLHVPPLRGRKEDIPMLVDSFFEKYAKLANRSPKTLTASCMSKLMEYDWPGNVRELENEIERLCVLSGDQAWIDEVNLSQRIIDVLAQQSAPYRLSGKLKDALEHLEKEMILTGLKRTKWNKSRLAKELGISRAGLIMKVEKYGLEKRDISESA